MMITPDKDLTSLGILVARLGYPVRTIEMAVLELNIMPVERRDGIPYFDRLQVEQISDRLAEAAAGHELPSIFDPRGCTPHLRRGIH